MFLAKVKVAAALLLTIGIVVTDYNPLSRQGHVRGQAGANKQATLVKEVQAIKPGEHTLPLGPTTWTTKPALITPGWLPASIAYSPDGTMMVVGGTSGIGGDTGKVVAYETAGLKKKWDVKVGGTCAAVAFAADGQSVLATVQHGIAVLDAATGKVVAALEEKDSAPLAVGAFPDRETMNDGKPVTGHKILFGDARGYFVREWFDRGLPTTIRLNARGAENRANLNAVPLAIDPSGQRAIVARPINARDNPWIWVAGEGKNGDDRRIQWHQSPVVSAAWSQDGQKAVTGDAGGHVIVWSAASMTPFAERFIQFTDRVAAVAISPNGKYTAAMTVGKKANIYGWKTYKQRAEMKPLHTISSRFEGAVRASLAFSPDGRQLAGAVMDDSWLRKTGKLMGSISFSGAERIPIASVPPAPEFTWEQDKPIANALFDFRTVVISPDTKKFAVESNDKTIVFETATSKKLYEVNGRFPCFTNGNLIAWTNRAVHYDPATGKEKKSYPALQPNHHFKSAQFSPDGQLIAGRDETTVRLVDVATGVEIVRLAGQGKPRGAVADAFPSSVVVWSSDGQRIAGVYGADEAGGKGGLAVWEAATGRQLARLEKTVDEPGRTMTFVFSPDGKKLVVAGRTENQDGVSLEWLDAATLKPIRAARINSRDGGADATALAYAPDGQTLAVGVNLRSGKGPYVRVYLWNEDTGKQGSWPLMSYDYPDLISALAFADAETLISATGSIVTDSRRPNRFFGQENDGHSILIWRGEPPEV